MPELGALPDAQPATLVQRPKPRRAHALRQGREGTRPRLCALRSHGELAGPSQKAGRRWPDLRRAPMRCVSPRRGRARPL